MKVIEHKPYDYKADVFSFGIALWELLTGEVSHLYKGTKYAFALTVPFFFASHYLTISYFHENMSAPLLRLNPITSSSWCGAEGIHSVINVNLWKIFLGMYYISLVSTCSLTLIFPRTEK